MNTEQTVEDMLLEMDKEFEFLDGNEAVSYVLDELQK